MSNNDLEKAYCPSQWCQRMPQSEVCDYYYKILTEGSRVVCEQFTAEHNILYGSSESQKLEIVYPKEKKDDAPVFVFIHGGYWSAGCPEQHLGVGYQLVNRGAVYVAIGYDLAPKVSLPEIVEQVKTGFALILKKFSNSRGIYLSGHSAGGHMASRILEVDWSKHVGLTNNPIKGAVLMSGLYDLLPLLHTSVNDDVHMTEDIAKEESPMEHITEVGKHCTHVDVVHVVVGEMESPEFKQQSLNYSESCREVGVNTEYKVISNVDHFNLIERFTEEDYVLTQMILKMMCLNIE